MAVIECVVNYDAKNGLTQVIHVLKMDEYDKINLVTQTPGLTLVCERGFDPLGLEAGDYAPLRYTPTEARATGGAQKLQVYYHPEPLKFKCGPLVQTNEAGNPKYDVHTWPNAEGLSAPGGGPG